jgi:hypothetical protein
MPRVDCWRLLGVSPGAGAEEVRAAFARRVQDVHPDAGGTGDGLTLRLLLEARDEALALVGGRPPPGHGRGATRAGAASAAGSRPARRHAPPGQATGGRYPCSACGQPSPHDRLRHELAGRGFRRRTRSAMVLLCPACLGRAGERRRNARFLLRSACLAGLFLLALWLW